MVDNGKVELSSRTAPGTAAWTGLEPGFTDLKKIKLKVYSLSASDNLTLYQLKINKQHSV